MGYIQYKHTLTHRYKHTHANTHTHANKHTRKHKHTHIFTNIHTYTKFINRLAIMRKVTAEKVREKYLTLSLSVFLSALFCLLIISP